jgi:hypothetical protein
MANMPRRIYDQLRYTFRHKMSLDSEWVTLHRLALLSGIQPINIDCCVNSCIAYTRQYIHHEECPYCKEARYTRSRKARRTFCYLPLIPRLQAFFQNAETVQMLSFRHLYERQPGVIRDIYDASWYQTLCRKKVAIDEIELRHRYFEGKNDIALGLAVDGYLLFKRRRGGPTATPILIQNYNLPPHFRTHLEHLICLGVIPGPHQPKDYESFLAPLDDECASLATGVHTFDALSRSQFNLHAYILFKDGDIVAIEKLLNIKGHNAVHPCRSCKIQGVRNVSSHGTVYYTPLETPDLPHQTRPSIDPRQLPLRTHGDFLTTISDLESATTKKGRENIAKQSGIRGPPALRRVASIDYARSVPWEWMHLFLENIVPTLVNLWTGQFKGLDTGTEDYELVPHIWAEIGEETACAVGNIPSAFVRVLGNIAEDRSMFTAEAWGFWFMYLAPILLKGRFQEDKYYYHMLKLSDLMKIMVKLELREEEVDMIENRLIEWVEEYEE